MSYIAQLIHARRPGVVNLKSFKKNGLSKGNPNGKRFELTHSSANYELLFLVTQVNENLKYATYLVDMVP